MANPFLRNSCNAGLYGIFERIQSKAWNFSESLESLLSLIYNLIPPTPGAEDQACMRRRCVPLNSNQRALGLGNSDSSSTLAQEVMRTRARNFGHLFLFEEIEVVGFPNVSGLHVRSCLVHELLCFVLHVFDNLNCIHCASLSGSVYARVAGCVRLVLAPCVYSDTSGGGVALRATRAALRAMSSARSATSPRRVSP
jgi:hypothetical protein